MTSMHRWLWALICSAADSHARIRRRNIAAACKAASLTRRRSPSLAQASRCATTLPASSSREQAGPEGRYLFDYVDPGTYTLTTELSGFATVVQRNVLVQARGDVTVDVAMKVAGLSETVTVETTPVAIQFNTSSKDLTLDQSLLEAIPNISRNPTQLAYLSPVVRNAGNKNETAPYHHWAGNDMDIGGGTRRRNDVLLDGTPLEAGPKVAYTPSMDAVAEFNVSTNAIDAEFGHSAGGIISMSLKSGTNAYHGTGYYVGRKSGLERRDQSRLAAAQRQHLQSDRRHDRHAAPAKQGVPLHERGIFARHRSAPANPDDADRARAAGGLLAVGQPRRQSACHLRPVDLEVRPQRSDHSRSISRQQDSARAVGSAGVPAHRRPLGARTMPGDDLTGLNNYKFNYEMGFKYLNYSTRLDWNISDKWKTFARVSRFQTDQDMSDYTGGADTFKMRPQQGSKRNGWNIAADTVYTMNSTTAINVRGAYYQVEDKRDYPDLSLTPNDFASLWPNNWYQPYMEGRPILYFPAINMGNYGTYGVDSAWWQIPEGSSLHLRFNKYLQRHSLKAGTEMRIKRGEAARFRFHNFFVNANATANTTSSPNLAQVGHPWASFLLGALDTAGSTASSAQYVPMQISDTEMYAAVRAG